jgi:hypothetical protein
MPAKSPPPQLIAAKSPTPSVTALRKAAADRQVARASNEGYAATALPQPAPASVTTPAAPNMMAPQVASDSAANAAPAMAEAAPVVAPHVRARMPVAPTPFTAAADMDTTSYASDTPAQELNKIRQLFALGHDDEERQRLSAFHLAHPRWDLPLDLQVQLRKP